MIFSVFTAKLVKTNRTLENKTINPIWLYGLCFRWVIKATFYIFYHHQHQPIKGMQFYARGHPPPCTHIL